MKYILARLESDASGKACDADSDPATIEHILPEDPGAGWESFPEQHWEAAVYRLGNLTLLEASANRRVGNLDFATKRQAYEHSIYALTQQLAEHAADNWTLDRLEARQAMFAARAVHLWRADYS